MYRHDLPSSRLRIVIACLVYEIIVISPFSFLQTSLLRSLKPTERVVKHMEMLDQEPEDEAEIERKKQEAKELELDAFGF